jgi:serine/threonine protein kinase
MPVSRPHTLEPGSLVADRYAIENLLGWGGMGEVYAAKDTQLNEMVALKTLPIFKVEARGLAQRLKGEAQLARRVTHPNVVRIFDFGTHAVTEPNAPQTFLPFLTMELLDGQTLRQRIRSEPRLLTAVSIKIAIETLAGLAAVHNAGIVHRDLKPDNIFLVSRNATNQERRTVLTDFGLAKPLDGLQSHQSQVGAVVGTLAYLSPEQREGSQATMASDIYAFGVVLFEMLTNVLPESSPVANLFAGANDEALSRGVPKALVHIVKKCLASDPWQRYQSADAVSLELKAVFKSEALRNSKAKTSMSRAWIPKKLVPITFAVMLMAVFVMVQISHSYLMQGPRPAIINALPLKSVPQAKQIFEASPAIPTPVPPTIVSGPPVEKRRKPISLLRAPPGRFSALAARSSPAGPVLQQQLITPPYAKTVRRRHPDDVIDPFSDKK